MAKVLFTAVVADMRNKLAGTVFSKNRYGGYTRTKTTPVNPQTSFQQNQRALLSAASSAWRGLTDAQRESWITGAQSFPFTDVFGRTMYLSGQALFVKLWINMSLAGQSPNVTAPNPVNVPLMGLSALSAEAAAGGGAVDLTITWGPVSIPAGFSLAIWATPGISAGKTFVKNLYRQIGVVGSVPDATALETLFNDRFGNVRPGERIFIKTALISNTTGQQGQPSELTAVVSQSA